MTTIYLHDIDNDIDESYDTDTSIKNENIDSSTDIKKLTNKEMFYMLYGARLHDNKIF